MVWERTHYYTRLYEKRPFFVRGIKPKQLANESKITQRRWKQYENHVGRENPILRGMRYLRVFENESVRTYAQASEILEVSRQRVFQHVVLVTKLSPQIIDFLMDNRDDLEISSCFTERRLRPLTRITDRQEQMAVFQDMLADLETRLTDGHTFSLLFKAE